MPSQLTFFERGPGVLCPPCPLLDACGASHTSFACLPWRGINEPGGVSVLHPSGQRTDEYFAALGGPEFVPTGAGTDSVKLGPYVPQIRVRRALAGYLDEGTYCIRAAEVIGRRRHVLTATELRTQVGLRDDQRIILLLFDSDPILERLWDEATHLLPEIADAEFDAVVAPSSRSGLQEPEPSIYTTPSAPYSCSKRYG